MSRLNGPRTKYSKRVGRNLFLKGARSYSAKDDYTKRPVKAGVHGNTKKFARISEYGKQLNEKQALRFVYGLTEKQLSNTFSKALHSKDETGYALLSLLEKRMDNIVYRAGLANSRAQARQLVSHGQFLLNGHRANIASQLLKAGDTITLKPNKKDNGFWSTFKLEVPNETVGWITKNDMTVKIITDPLVDDLPKEFNVGNIIEYYSRRVK
jgi:small subunit ribosomal protein S4